MRVVRVLLGVLAILVALPMLLAGVALWAVLQHRAPDGSFTAPLAPIQAGGYAVVVPDVDVLLRREAPFARGDETGMRFTACTGAGPAFIGLAPRDAVDRYLAGVGYGAISEVRLARGGLPVTMRQVPGANRPKGPPIDQTFWVTSSTSGSLFWSPSAVRGKSFALVVMNVDGSRVDRVRASAAMTPRWLDPSTWGLLILGTVLFLIGMVLLFWPRRQREIVYVVEPSQVPRLAAVLGVSAGPLAAALAGTAGDLLGPDAPPGDDASLGREVPPGCEASLGCGASLVGEALPGGGAPPGCEASLGCGASLAGEALPGGGAPPGCEASLGCGAPLVGEALAGGGAPLVGEALAGGGGPSVGEASFSGGALPVGEAPFGGDASLGRGRGPGDDPASGVPALDLAPAASVRADLSSRDLTSGDPLPRDLPSRDLPSRASAQAPTAGGRVITPPAWLVDDAMVGPTPGVVTLPVWAGPTPLPSEGPGVYRSTAGLTPPLAWPPMPAPGQLPFAR